MKYNISIPSMERNEGIRFMLGILVVIALKADHEQVINFLRKSGIKADPEIGG